MPPSGLPIASSSWPFDSVDPASRVNLAQGRAGAVLGKTRRVHFVGVGGIGMSGIAELLANLGYVVSGSDAKRSAVTDRLESLGVTVTAGHAAANVGDADVVVYSSAVRPDNPEVVEARARRIPVIPRAEMLAELMRLRFGIAVAGAHGKTSTTSMIALVLERAGLDPTAVIGGRLSAFGSNARLGRGDYMVAEADESDRSFLKLSPSIAVITNIDREHMDAYGSFADLQQAFVDFANKVPFYGAVVACADDAELRAVMPKFQRRVITYGIDAARPGEDASAGHDPPQRLREGGPMVVATDVRLEGFGSRCTIERHERRGGAGTATLGPLTLWVPGRHSVQNALAAVAVGLELDVPFARIASALAEFRGAERRFEHRGVINNITVIDDYGHHPTEIAAVLAAARAANPPRIVVAFQPHRYTRTRDLMAEFGTALAAANEVVLTDIYAASEDPIPGVTIEALAAAVNEARVTPVHVVPQLADMAGRVADLARPGDLVITLGAGSIGGLATALLAELHGRYAAKEGS
jgi:UDP-N-acetylmuramate--alanine ligase